MWFLFLLLWIGFLYLPTVSKPSPSIRIQEPIYQQNCSAKRIDCVDDCSFLCVERQAQCVGGVCVPKDQGQLECNKEKGGRLMLTKDPVRSWICLCTDETFWSGPACDMLNPDVCEHGAFLYNGRNDNLCLCPTPYKKVVVKGKPHCLDTVLANFFDDETSHVAEQIGPSQQHP